MPIFRVRFARTVTEVDYFERDIAAGSKEEAHRKAREIANDANMNCPDDVTCDHASECDDWGVDTIKTLT